MVMEGVKVVDNDTFEVIDIGWMKIL